MQPGFFVFLGGELMSVKTEYYTPDGNLKPLLQFGVDVMKVIAKKKS